jgi:uncharacterized membrane protein YhaH (DUF805 family)
MSHLAHEDWFSLTTRRNRKSFIFANIYLLSMAISLFFILALFDATMRASNIITVIFYIPFIIVGYTLSAQRLRDMNITGWISIIWLIIGFLPDWAASFVSLTFWLFLISVPGSIKENRYGPPCIFS